MILLNQLNLAPLQLIPEAVLDLQRGRTAGTKVLTSFDLLVLPSEVPPSQCGEEDQADGSGQIDSKGQDVSWSGSVQVGSPDVGYVAERVDQSVHDCSLDMWTSHRGRDPRENDD